MSDRYGGNSPNHSGETIIVPKLNSKGDRYSKTSPLKNLIPIIINGSIKIENGKVYIDADIPLILRRGNQNVVVNLSTGETQIQNGG